MTDQLDWEQFKREMQKAAILPMSYALSQPICAMAKENWYCQSPFPSRSSEAHP